MSLTKVLVAVAIVGFSIGNGYPHHDNDHGYSYVTKHDGHYGGSQNDNGGYDGLTGHIGNGYGYTDDGDNHEDYNHHPKYSFEYGVKDAHTGDHKKHWETRDGDVVKGGYSVHEPDGTKLEVEYTADKHSGFNAIVKRIGHPHHPEVYAQNYKGYEQENNGYDHGHDNGHHGAVSYSHVSQHY